MTCHLGQASDQMNKQHKTLQQATVVVLDWRDCFLSVLLSTTLSFLVIHAEEGESHE